jgi:hypothetical protein
MFLHLHFADATAAQAAGQQLALSVGTFAFNPRAAFALWRVTTRTMVRPS